MLARQGGSELGKVYRKLAAQYHPDKVQDQNKKAVALKKFRLIATAYETLKDDETRVDYDYYLDHPEHRAYNYYQYYRRRVTPKVDPKIVIIVTILCISAFQFLSATHKYNEALNFAMRQDKYRNAAKEIAKQKDISLELGSKRDKKSRKEYAEQVLRQIIQDNVDIRGGYRKPSLYDTLLWKLFSLPVILYRYVVWNVNWVINYNIRRLDYDDESKYYLIRRNMGLTTEQFNLFKPEELQSFMEESLWRSDAFRQWKEEREMAERQNISARYKRYRRFMRNQSGNTISFVE